MATNFDIPPIYDALTKLNRDKLSDVWQSWFATFIETIVTYLTQGGIFIPTLTTAERDALQNVQDGQMIYNTTLGRFQGYEAGVWRTFTLT